MTFYKTLAIFKRSFITVSERKNIPAYLSSNVCAFDTLQYPEQ